MVAIKLRTISRFFRQYSNAFTTDDALSNLNSLRFSQSNRMADPNDPMRIITTTTTTTFSMSREIAMSICQHFMNAHLLRSATDPQAMTFKDRGIYQMTPKGLHLLERFIEKNGMDTNRFATLFASEPMNSKMIHLDRRSTDDEIQLNRNLIHLVWIKFAGKKRSLLDRRKPASGGGNSSSSSSSGPGGLKARRALDVSALADVPPIEVEEMTDKDSTGREVTVWGFESTSAIDWLCNLTTCCCREEAAELMAHFVRCGLIRILRQSDETSDRFPSVEARVIGQIPFPETDRGRFVFDPRVKYIITDEGKYRAQWEGATPTTVVAVSAAVSTKKPSSEVSVDETSSTASKGRVNDGGAGGDTTSPLAAAAVPGGGGGSTTSGATTTTAGPAQEAAASRSALPEPLLPKPSPYTETGDNVHSSTAKLKQILEDPVSRNLFQEFLKANYCDENLAYWRAVEEFRRRFSTTSSAAGGGVASGSSGRTGNASNAMEAHQQELVTMAHQIYYKHLQPLAPNELNIDHTLRTEVTSAVAKYLFPSGSATKSSTGGPLQPPVAGSEHVPEHQTRATHIQSLLAQYERVQDHIFRLLASDQLPRFMVTDKWKQYKEEQVSGLSVSVI